MRTRILRSDLISQVALVSLTAVSLAGCSLGTERLGSGSVYTGSTENQRAILSNGAAQPSFQDIVNGTGGTTAGLPPASSQPIVTGSITQPNTVPVRVSAPSVSAPTYTAPQYTAPTYTAPTYTAPTYVAPKVKAPVYVAPKVQAPVYQPPTVQAPRITAPSISSPSVSAAGANSWRGWSSTGGTRIPVRSGDTVTSLSRRYGVPVEAIVAVNGIEDPSQVRPGQTIVIPTYVYSSGNGASGATTKTASMATAVPTGAATRNVGLVNVGAVPKPSPYDQVITGSVRPTETVYSSTPMPERKPYHQPTFAEISSGKVANDATPIQITSGPKTKPSSWNSARNEPRKVGSVSGYVPMPKDSAKGQQSSGNDARPTEPITRPQVVANVEPVSAVIPSFRWPVRGRIISNFGSKPGGTRNDGVNLAVPEGTPVKAADNGTVIYSGNELKGYGNLVLLRHENGWVSAYAHNSKLNVKRGDKVTRGEVVGLAGATGSVSQPQVHFELRRGNKPVDPMKYMPST
ncbi:peptidoglycan DD-metalloendopeptidase family protein [Roseibium algae]|uniref:Peptidoglycan DD-metalloendopeptidase family protein n=1 Tax=Roseibium algae TaxID=3123038 RepID=A0ABU8TR20_9HYPH